MRQLSGGQKALVALALIFAIQRSDPAPFYLFDEIDQALDANYRAEVASLIKRQAEDATNPAQFIVVSFRPEMVQVAHRHYGIALTNKASNIYQLNKSDAQKFVLDLMEHEEVGTTAAIGTFKAPEKEIIDDFTKQTVEDEDKDEAETKGDDDDDDVENASPEVIKAREFEEESGVRLDNDDSSDDDSDDPFENRTSKKVKRKTVTKKIQGVRRKTRAN